MSCPVSMYSPETFEPWSYKNPDTVGIGGSETALIVMAEQLAARGHPVRVYAPIPADTPTPHKGVEWHHIDETDWTRPGHWIISRAPTVADNFSMRHPGQTLWLICQDEDYPVAFKERGDRPLKFNRIVALCESQAEQFRLFYPWLASRICVSSNGIRRDLVESVLAENLPRDPARVIYTSSPDRGLEPLLAIHNRLREYQPDSTLHVCYGFDNIDKAIAKFEIALAKGELPAKQQHWLAGIKDLKSRVMVQPGVVHHGRMPQRELYRQIAQAGVWIYATGFKETSCISSMEMQALGAIPIVSPVWAVGENVHHGVHIPGDPIHDWLTQARFVGEANRLMLEPARAEAIRREMMPWALGQFEYGRWVDQWQAWMVEDGKR